MTAFKLNATASRIVEFIRANPGHTKRAIAISLGMAIGTIDGYMGPLKEHGYLDADRGRPPRYWIAGGPRKLSAQAKDPAYLLTRAVYAMVSVGKRRTHDVSTDALAALPSRIFRQSMEVNDELEAAA